MVYNWVAKPIVKPLALIVRATTVLNPALCYGASRVHCEQYQYCFVTVNCLYLEPSPLLKRGSRQSPWHKTPLPYIKLNGTVQLNQLYQVTKQSNRPWSTGLRSEAFSTTGFKLNKETFNSISTPIPRGQPKVL